MTSSLKSQDCGPAGGLLLVGHGSRESAGTLEFLEIARLVAGMVPQWAVEPCFLEFARPTIAEGFQAVASHGICRLTVVPALLFSAAHAQRDIPEAVATVAAEHPGISVTQSEHLGCHPAIVELSQARYDEALRGLPQVAPQETVLVMVGRGSHDPGATAEMQRFVELRQRLTTLAEVQTAFVAMADPPLETVLGQVARRAAGRIVVQPHLLFGGVLVERISALVARFAEHYPHLQWVTTGHLGPSPGVAAAIVDRAASTL